METAIFKSFENGYFTFIFENGSDMIFEEIHPKALYQFDLKNDRSLIGKEFVLNFTENFTDDDEDFVIYRIESLKLV